MFRCGRRFNRREDKEAMFDAAVAVEAMFDELVELRVVVFVEAE